MRRYLFFLCFIGLFACSSSSTYLPGDEDEGPALRSEMATGAAESRIDDLIDQERYDSYAETAAAEDYEPPSPKQSAGAASECVSWKEAFRHIGERTCVTGTVTSTYNSGKAFFINFSSNRSSFYAVSFDFTWENLQGECVIVTGGILEYENRPEIIIRDPAQLEGCP